MARRKTNRNSTPNIPQETLERARQQLGVTPPPPAEEAQEAPVQAVARVVETLPPPASTRRRKPTTSSQRITQSQFEKAKQRGELDFETIQEHLNNPTKFTTPEEMRKDYTTVVKDLRDMGLLAAVLIGLLVVVAQFIN